MERSSYSSRYDDVDLNLREWTLKARISRENTSSRRFSASNLRSFREDSKGLKPYINISSTASSPGYTSRAGEIDPSTYSFTTAMKALQAKTVYTWEYLSPNGYTLHSKWNDAEKYISNPFSGEVPLECLSSKAISNGGASSFRRSTNRITMSAPLIYPSPLQQFQTKSTIIEQENEEGKANGKVSEEIIKANMGTRDAGTQSTLTDLLSISPIATPSIQERSRKHNESESGDSSDASTGKIISELKEVEVKVINEKQCIKTKEGGQERKRMKYRCLSLRFLWLRRRKLEKKQTPPNKIA